jgi:hypothetical protein
LASRFVLACAADHDPLAVFVSLEAECFESLTNHGGLYMRKSFVRRERIQMMSLLNKRGLDNAAFFVCRVNYQVCESEVRSFP